MKKKSLKRVFKSVKAMDHYLESHDLSKVFVSRGKVSHPKAKKINLDLPPTIVNAIDNIAGQIGIARQPLIKMWIHEKIREELS